MPLHYYYETTPIHETVEDLLSTGQAPIYIVHFSQAAALERAQALAGAKVATREQRDAIAELIGGFRFTTSFGKTLSRLLRLGIGVHHAGMLPKYRRLVEQLAQSGQLRVICGTGHPGRRHQRSHPHRAAHRAHQVRRDEDAAAQRPRVPPDRRPRRPRRLRHRGHGRRAGSARLVKKAGDDPVKLKRIVRKKAPDGFVSWGEPSFQRLVAAEPETLTSEHEETAAMLINVIGPGETSSRTCAPSYSTITSRGGGSSPSPGGRSPSTARCAPRRS